MSNTQTLDAMRMPLICLLEELAAVLNSLSDEQYTRKLSQVFDSSVANHVRHELDHVSAYLVGVSTADLNYDRRQRGTDVETSRAAAIDQIRRLTEQLRNLPDDIPLDRPIQLNVLLSADAPPVDTTTTAAREAAFVVSHTVHHNAIISVMVNMLGGKLPPRFGYAPSTLAYLRDQND